MLSKKIQVEVSATSKNWQGQPLIDIETVISLISNTTTKRTDYYLPV